MTHSAASIQTQRHPSATRPGLRRFVVLCALLAAPTILLVPAMPPSRALLPADLLVHFAPWRSQVAPLPDSHFDALVWDGIAQYYPWRHFAAESLRAGHVPLWNPYQFCGTPFLANGQSAVLYPLNLIFWILPAALAFVWSAWLHLALTGWFAYLLLRRFGAARVGAVAGAVVWQANSFTVAWIHLPTVLCTVAWLPLLLLLCERALLSPRGCHPEGAQRPKDLPSNDSTALASSLWAGLALALSYLGGHPQIFLFVALLSAVYLLARGLGPGAGGPMAARLGRVAASGTIVGCVALGVAAVQLLPTLDFLRLAHRSSTPGPESYAFYLKRGLQPVQLIGLFLPHPLGNPGRGTYVGPENYAEYTLYIGPLGLALALAAIIFSRTWHARFFAGTGVVALLAALGTDLNWPLYHWVPGIANTGTPARLIVLYVFAFSLLAGMGVDVLRRGKNQDWLLVTLYFMALLGVLVTIMFGLAGNISRDIPVLKPALRHDVVSVAVAAACALALLMATVLVRRTAALPVGLTVLVAVDLLFAARGHLHIVPRTWVYPEVTAGDLKESLGAPPQEAPASGRDSRFPIPDSRSRVLGNAADWPLRQFPTAALPPNAATVYHLRDAFGYDSLYFAHYRDFAALIQDGDPSPPENGNMLLARVAQVPDAAAEMMRLAGVGTVLSPIPVMGLELLQAGDWYQYRVPRPRPRARVVASALAFPDHRQAIAATASLRAGEEQVIIELASPPRPALAGATAPATTLQDPSANTVTVELIGEGGGWLVLADTYAPGWHAYAGGKEVPILLADTAFRAVPLTRRVHNVEFRYEPAAYRVGLFVTLLALAGLGAAVGITAARAEAGRARRTSTAERGSE